MSSADLVDDRRARRYRLLVAGQEVAFVDYDPVGEDSILVKHTEVLAGHEDRGHGAEIVRRVLDDARVRGLTVIPICP
jgi:predicted GNAT family acetyltransferase